MAVTHELTPGRIYMGKLPHGSDLLEALTAFCVEKHIRLGRIDAIGAVGQARVGFYHHDTREYRHITYDAPLEILCLTGNISLKDDAPMVHAHVTLADKDGHAMGGHLAVGTTVFACEFTIQELIGVPLKRTYDDVTGLPLWDI